MPARRNRSFMVPARARRCGCDGARTSTRSCLRSRWRASPSSASSSVVRRSPWRRQQRIEATQTVALQLWGSPSLADLGWRGPPPLLSLFWDPLNTWCDMSQTLPFEPWADADPPRLVAYFCGPLAHSWPGPESWRLDPERDRAWRLGVQAQAAEARQVLLANVSQLWPAVDAKAGPADTLGSRGWYLRANHDPHARCTLALPRQSANRISADDTGYANLTVAGDWTANHILVACLEGTVQSAIRAARAVSQRPELYPIVGEELLEPGGAGESNSIRPRDRGRCAGVPGTGRRRLPGRPWPGQLRPQAAPEPPPGGIESGQRAVAANAKWPSSVRWPGRPGGRLRAELGRGRPSVRRARLPDGLARGRQGQHRRNADKGNRVEQNGSHYLFGCYHNASPWSGGRTRSWGPWRASAASRTTSPPATCWWVAPWPAPRGDGRPWFIFFPDEPGPSGHRGPLRPAVRLSIDGVPAGLAGLLSVLAGDEDPTWAAPRLSRRCFPCALTGSSTRTRRMWGKVMRGILLLPALLVNHRCFPAARRSQAVLAVANRSFGRNAGGRGCATGALARLDQPPARAGGASRRFWRAARACSPRQRHRLGLGRSAPSAGHTGRAGRPPWAWACCDDRLWQAGGLPAIDR